MAEDQEQSESDNADRAVLLAALEPAYRAYKNQKPAPSLLGPGPSKEILGPLEEAIERCACYRSVAGSYLFNGGSAPVIAAPMLSGLFFQRTSHWEESQKAWVDDVPWAADWLIRVLKTKIAKAYFRVAIWGVTLDQEIQINDRTRILPFADLPDTNVKGRFIERSKNTPTSYVWLSNQYYNVPGTAIEITIDNFPYIGSDGLCFEWASKFTDKAREFWHFVQAVTIGKPVAMCTWLDHADRELEFAEWEKWPSWIIPEIAPRIHSSVALEASMVKTNWDKYAKLPKDVQSNLTRSVERFVLSGCRHNPIDRVLDLVLAFEIAVGGGKGDNAAPRWKVGVRSSQMIGGSLAVRQGLRDKLNKLYGYRSEATHGGTMSRKEQTDLQVIVAECSAIYVALMRSFLELGTKPDWARFELEPRVDH